MRTSPKNFMNLFNNQNNLCCKFLNSELFFDYENNIGFCPIHSDLSVIRSFEGIWFDFEKLNTEKKRLINAIKSGNQDIPCSSCEYLTNEILKNTQELSCIHIGHWKNCYINCKYCKAPKEEDLIKAKHYDIFPVIKNLINIKQITQKTKIIFECGDATVHPEFDKLMYYLVNNGMKNIIINTAGLRYCESIENAIAKNAANVVISLDSGCGYVYKMIKGLNKFDLAISNIKRYLCFQEPNQKRVILKYVLVKGINDNQKEILDWFILSRDLGVKKLAFDIENDWYKEIKNNIPQYLKELILFTEQISKYNNIEIEFYDKLTMLYNSIIKDSRNNNVCIQ